MGLPGYLQPDSPQKKGRKQEDIARKTINSGAVWFDPADLEVTKGNTEYLVDVKKVVTQKSFQLSLKDVAKLHKQAVLKTPMFLIFMGDYVIKASVQRIKSQSGG